MTIDMPMVEPKRVTVREKSTVVEDRDFVFGGDNSGAKESSSPA